MWIFLWKKLPAVINNQANPSQGAQLITIMNDKTHLPWESIEYVQILRK